MSKDKQVTSRRDAALERLRSRYPDEMFDDDEQIFGKINDDYDQYENELNGYKEREGAFSNLFTSDPRSARIMQGWRDGDDPAVALVRLYGTEIKEAIDDPQKQEAIAEANKEFMERVAQEKDYEQQYTSNLAVSLNDIEKKQAEKNLSDEEINKATEWIMSITTDAIMGKISPETIEFAIKAQNYDSAVAQADAEGEIRGKNTKVRETLRKPSRGDGTVHLDGKNAGGRDLDTRGSLGAMERYGDGNMNIFERGGEKRTPMRR